MESTLELARKPALEFDRCFEALKARDARFDGAFYVGVSSTSIYCRPICPARLPLRRNCDFFPSAASAERAGYRPCLRCRPELAPGHGRNAASVDAGRRVAHQAAARIQAGALNEAGLDALAAEFDLSARQLRRVVEAEFGVAPLALAQTRRLLLAKQLLTESSLPITRVAEASGFASLRRFNALFRARYGLNPESLRSGASSRCVDDDQVRLRLSYRPPLDWPALLRFLGGRGAVSVEAVDGAQYQRTVRIGAVTGWIAVTPATVGTALVVAIAPSLLPVLTPLLARLRALFDLDAQPAVIAAHLGSHALEHPLLAASVAQHPGLRVPGAFDGFELCLRAVLGQQISVRAATTVFGRFANAFGAPIATPFSALTRLCPTAESIAEAPLATVIALGVTERRARTIQAVANACMAGELVFDPGLAHGQRAETMRQRLRAIPGIGDWTASYVAMRALADPDAFPHGDLALCKAAGNLKPADLLQQADRWRPWRAYAALHLWNSLAMADTQHQEMGG